MMPRTVVAILSVILLGSTITSDDSLFENKRDTKECSFYPCQNSSEGGKLVGVTVSLAILATMVVLGVVCSLWKNCLERSKEPDAGDTRCNGPNTRHVSDATSIVSMTLDMDDFRVSDLYSFDSCDNDPVLKAADLSVVESFDLQPVASCSPYHLTYTSPTEGQKAVAEKNTSPLDNQNCKPECDQDRHSTDGTVISPDKTSVNSSTPYHTPLVGYARGRPHPTPIERLASSKSSASPKPKPFTPSRIDFSMSPKTRATRTPARIPHLPITPSRLLQEKARLSVNTPVQRLIDLQVRMSRSDDVNGSRLEDSLQWDSYPFRGQEESLMWDDYLMDSDRESVSKVDENCNDPAFGSLQDAPSMLT